MPEPGRVPREHLIGTNADLLNHLGASVRALRHGLGLTQEELAERAHLHRTYVADIERGARNITLHSLATLAQGLGVRLCDVFQQIAVAGGTATRKPGGDLRDILLVEHDTEAARQAADVFRRAGLAHPLHIVRSGKAAFDYLLGRGRYARNPPALPQLILVVPDLPGMSPEQFLSALGAEKGIGDLPVLVLGVSAQRPGAFATLAGFGGRPPEPAGSPAGG